MRVVCCVWDGFRWVYGYVCACVYESGVRCGTVLGGCTGMCVYPRAYMRVVCCVGRFKVGVRVCVCVRI